MDGVKFPPTIIDDGESIKIHMPKPELYYGRYVLTLSRNDVIKMIREGAAVLLPEGK